MEFGADQDEIGMDWVEWVIGMNGLRNGVERAKTY